jgi:hypothetical protein
MYNYNKCIGNCHTFGASVPLVVDILNCNKGMGIRKRFFSSS